jgi:hypothetical protein
MISFPTNTRTSHGGLLLTRLPLAGLPLAGLLLFSGALGSGDVLAQQFSATQPVTQTTGQIPGQTPGQVDLLATVQDNDSAEAMPTITSIDEAVRAISGNADDAIMADNASNASLADNATEAAPVSIAVSPVADNATDAAELVPATAPTTTLVTTSPSTGATTSPSGSVSLKKADAPSFGVADIGIDPAPGDDSALTATIWRGTSVDRAAMLLDSAAVIGSSPALSSLASDVVARRAVRPEGASETDQNLMSGRLDWLAAAGRSEDLAVMVDQLPNEAPWLAWKQWLVETQLMTRRDADACRNVMYQVGRTFEPFWHKAKVICTAVHKGDIAGAQFAADILLAMGVDDPAFAGLVGKLLNGADPGPIDPALVDQLHIVLMEAAHHDIDIAGLDALPESSIQTAVGLRYLDPDARLVATWRALSHGLIDHERAAKLWRSAAVETDPPMLALARHQSQPSALTRALVWRALDAEKSVERLPFIAAAMDVDIANGAGRMMAPLYADLGREALEFSGAEALLASDEGALRTKLAMLIGVGDSADMPAALSGGEAGAARDLLEMAQTGRVDMTSLAILGKYSLLPLAISGDGMVAMEPGEAMSWLVAASPGAIRTETFLSASPIIMQALDEAAAEGRVAETILLAHRAVGTHNLAEMNPADVARIAAALDAVDQTEPAHRFRRDVVAAHLLVAAHAQAIDLPPVTAATSAQGQTPESPASGTGDGSDAGSVTETTGDSSGMVAGQDSDAANTLTPTTGTAPATAQQTNDNNL